MARRRSAATLLNPHGAPQLVYMTDEETIVDLAARFEQFYPVVTGMTLGMMLANIPALVLGDPLAGKLPVKAIRIIAAVVFAVLGMLTLLGVGR